MSNINNIKNVVAENLRLVNKYTAPKTNYESIS